MHGLVNAVNKALAKGQQLALRISTSNHYKHWISVDDLRRCFECKKNHGKIWLVSETPVPSPPAHPNCRCVFERMKAISAGTATINGEDGADWKIKHEGSLPDYYISIQDAVNAGWRYGRWPSNFVPGKMLTGGVYNNDDGHLPMNTNRQWYEADINYSTGRRNKQRIVWSNDGLIFVTYDHYETFYEIVGE